MKLGVLRSGVKRLILPGYYIHSHAIILSRETGQVFRSKLKRWEVCTDDASC